MCLAPAAVAVDVATGELQEADVLWPEPDNDDDNHQDHRHCHGRRRRQLDARDKEQPQDAGGDGGEAPRGGEVRRRAGPSAPVGIRPGNATGASSWARSYDDDDSDEPAAAFVPPHLVLAARRRRSESEGRVASSVCVGRGRTLKGRDLQSVRTAVLRMTGFLEN